MRTIFLREFLSKVAFLAVKVYSESDSFFFFIGLASSITPSSASFSSKSYLETIDV